MKRVLRAFLLVGFAAIILFPGQAPAVYEIYERGVLVPYATYGDGVNTTVGLVYWTPNTAVYWSFISEDGSNLKGGSIAGAADKWGHSFNLESEDGGTNRDTVSYLIFTWDDNGTLTTAERGMPVIAAMPDDHRVAANAVLLQTAAGVEDAVLIPVVPLRDDDYADIDLKLTKLFGGALTSLYRGMASGEIISTRYWIDPVPGAATRVVIWSASAPVFTSRMNSVTGPLEPVSFSTPHSNLNVINVATDVVGIPVGYVDGSLELEESDGSSYFVFSLISSDVFKATQTLLAVKYVRAMLVLSRIGFECMIYPSEAMPNCTNGHDKCEVK